MPSISEFRLRAQFLLAHELYEALLVLVQACDRSTLVNLNKEREQISTVPLRILKREFPKLKREIAQIKKQYGAVAPDDEYRKTLQEARKVSQHILFLPKSHVDKLFVRYHEIFPQYGSLPLHTRIGVDAHGFTEKGQVLVSRFQRNVAVS